MVFSIRTKHECSTLVPRNCQDVRLERKKMLIFKAVWHYLSDQKVFFILGAERMFSPSKIFSSYKNVASELLTPALKKIKPMLKAIHRASDHILRRTTNAVGLGLALAANEIGPVISGASIGLAYGVVHDASPSSALLYSVIGAAAACTLALPLVAKDIFRINREAYEENNHRRKRINVSPRRAALLEENF